MMLSFYQKLMSFALGLMLAGSVASVRCADIPAPRPNNDVLGKTELLTAVLRGPLAMYNAKLNFKDATADKKFWVGISTDLIRASNESLALYNAWKKGDLGYPANGNQLHQFASLAFIAQDLGTALSRCGSILGINLNLLEDDEDADFDTNKEKTGLTENQLKISLLTKKIVRYVLPAVEGIAAVTRAYESHRTQNDTNKRIQVLNYLCFVAIAGCRIISEYSTSENGSWVQVLAVTKTVLCASLLIADIIRLGSDAWARRLTDYKNKIAEAKAAQTTAETAATTAIQEKNTAVEQKTAAETQRDTALTEKRTAETAKQTAEAKQQDAETKCRGAEQARLENILEYDSLNLPREKTTMFLRADDSAQRKVDHNPLIPVEIQRLHTARQIFELIWNRDGRVAYNANTESVTNFINKVNTVEDLRGAGAAEIPAEIRANPLITNNALIVQALKTAINARIPGAAALVDAAHSRITERRDP